jgi:ubiquinol-cytochrome c reductase iron-sulfur subunit
VSGKQLTSGPGRSGLARLTRYFGLAAVAAIVYVLLDFSIDLRPPAIQSSYRFSVAELAPDEARILRQDNLAILVMRRSAETIASLRQPDTRLQDPESNDSSQPGFARNALRSRHPQYFVSYAIGTDLGCAIEVQPSALQEICSGARYDFAGRALKGANKFPNLPVPDYNFTNNFSTLTIKP